MNQYMPSKPQLSRRAFLGGGLVATATGAAFILTGCSPSSTSGNGAAGDKQSATFMTALGLSLSFVEVMVAKERGFFDEFDLNLDIKGGTGTSSAIQAVLGNSVELSRTAGINSIIARANEDAPLLSIATVRQSSQFEIVSLAEKPIREATELTGKTVGVVSAGGSTENLLDMVLISAGVDPSTVNRPVTGVGTAAYELAKAGEVDAWISVNNDRMVINDELGPVHYFNTDEYAPVPSDTYNISQSLHDSDTDMPSRFLAGVLKAMEYASNPDNHEQVIDDLLAYTPDTDREQSLKGLPIVVDGWTAGGTKEFLTLDEEAWAVGQDLMHQAGLINQTVGLDVLITQKYIDEARQMI